ncbi:MAG: chorismate-binding protein [Rhodospirillaceae bacterium]|nr:chorismate-binding protein [Rhodospirillaceae bacterium]
MTKFSKKQCEALSFASGNGLPFAFWREPGHSGFLVLISTMTPRRQPVFMGNPIPGFVAAPFRTRDANSAWYFVADILIDVAGMRFRSDLELRDNPASELQFQISEGAPRIPIRAQVQAHETPEAIGSDEYKARVSRAVETIRTGHCDKIVLSRVEPRDLNPSYDLIALAEELANVHAHAFISVISSLPTGTWLTATPEILLTVNKDSIGTMALAGTQWPPKGTEINSIDWPQKIVEEQGLVAEYIREAFYSEGIPGVEETPPYTVQAANLCHLRSDFSAPAVPESVLAGLLRRLHPTSAVCGMPKDRAREFILHEEGDTRGLYTGYLGPAHIGGNGSLYVNLRSAQVAGNQIYLHVGGGIVSASVPAVEWEETVEKTKTLTCVL